MPESLSQVATRLIVSLNSTDALAFSFLPPGEIATLLVDNNSTDDTVAKARQLGYRILDMGYNAGYARAINAGLRVIETPLVLILNPDLRLPLHELSNLVQAAQCYPEADILVPRLFSPDNREFFRFETRFEARTRHRHPPQGDASIRAMSGAAMLVRRQPFLDAGGFDENIFLYFEDDDVAFRFCKAKKPIVYVHGASAEHLGNASSKTDAKLAYLKQKSLGWSWAYCMRKHGLGNRFLSLLAILGKIIGHAATFQTAKLRRDIAYLDGFLSALRGRPAPFPD